MHDDGRQLQRVARRRGQQALEVVQAFRPDFRGKAFGLVLAADIRFELLGALHLAVLDLLVDVVRADALVVRFEQQIVGESLGVRPPAALLVLGFVLAATAHVGGPDHRRRAAPHGVQIRGARPRRTRILHFGRAQRVAGAASGRTRAGHRAVPRRAQVRLRSRVVSAGYYRERTQVRHARGRHPQMAAGFGHGRYGLNVRLGLAHVVSYGDHGGHGRQVQRGGLVELLQHPAGLFRGELKALVAVRAVGRRRAR